MRRIILTALIILTTSTMMFGQSKLLRFPNSSDTQITFTHAGDIFVVPINGGLARRVTVSDGIEMFPRFSPDGKTIAFAGEYNGNQQVFVMPSEGGMPIQRTFNMDVEGLPERMGPNKIILEWTKDGKDVVYRSREESWHVLEGKIFTVPAIAGIPKTLDLPNSGYASLSPDGSKIAYNRIFRDYRTWKRYRGGQVADVWIYDFKSKELTQVTNNDSQDIMPIWNGDKIYYISDRTGTMNLYRYDTKSKEEKQITNSSNYDVKFPSKGTKHIAFELGGEVQLMDYATETVKAVSITVQDDFPTARTRIEAVSDEISGSTVSPDGKWALFSARGDIYVVSKEKGITKNLTNSSNAHDRNPVWSPDGNWIAYISDISGEYEIYLVKPDGSETKQLTKDFESYRYEMKWSPDSKNILTSDKSMKLYYYSVPGGNRKEVVKSKSWEIRDYNWSPDSKWVVYTDNLNPNISGVFIHSITSGKNELVTNKFFNASQGVFSPAGNFLFYTSNRSFNADINNLEWNYSYADMSKIYGVPLKKETKSPFLFEGFADKKEDDKKDDKDKKEKDVTVEIDFDGIKDRVFDVPTSAGNYFGLTPTKDHKMYYVKTSASAKPTTYLFDFNEKEEKQVGSFYQWDITPDFKNIFIKSGEDYYIQKLADKIETSAKDKIDLSNMETKINPVDEWNQIYSETWRQLRDFFYDPGMHGVDWKEMRTKYEALMPYVQHRSDLTYVLGELISELNVGHAYVGGGDMPKVKTISIGQLGADLVLDGKNWKFTNILVGRNWEESKRSPLTEPGVDVTKGMYLLAIDDVKVTDEFTPNMALENKANKLVKITVNTSNSMSGAKEYYIKTIKSDNDLRYYNWVEGRRKIVDEKSGGKIGYIHIPDMGVGNGLNEFAKTFYSQLDKEGLIIDDRYNGGGNVSPMIIERLRRYISIAQHIRNQEDVSAKPDATFMGPMVCLINEMSMSDGDLFPYQFRYYGLGKLIGKRTWGGVIGIRGSLPFIDGGYLTRPEFANLGARGDWVLEGTGISPDIEVDNHPAKVMEGIDQQLERAIEEVQKEMKTFDKNKKLPVIPPFPDKSKKK
ncbi:MAG: S41 family peptidase [Candidatus Kapaibacterium sp.]